jgi:beta-lactam-binding protein with PASTA domain
MNKSRVVTARFQGLCIVPRVKGETLRAAKKNIRKAHCRTGKTSRRYSMLARGHLVSQRPRAKRQLHGGAKVDLVVSKGRRPQL